MPPKFIRGDKETVRELISDIRLFAAAINEETRRMRILTEELSDFWRDSQYRQFQEYMQALCEALDKKSELAEEVALALGVDLDKW